MGQADDDDGVRTAGRPFEDERGPPRRTKRVPIMMTDEDCERFDRFAQDSGLSRSTAVLVLGRKMLLELGY